MNWKENNVENKNEAGKGVAVHYPLPIHLTEPIKNNEILNELSSSLTFPSE